MRTSLTEAGFKMSLFEVNHYAAAAKVGVISELLQHFSGNDKRSDL